MMNKIIVAVIVIIVIIAVVFLKDIYLSKKDFQGKPMKKVFSTLIEYFNHEVFGGNVKIIKTNTLDIILIHNISSQHRVVLEYMTGYLVIKWSWKYLHQELNHSVRIPHILNVSEDKMREILTGFSKEMAVKMKKHSDIINQMG